MIRLYACFLALLLLSPLTLAQKQSSKKTTSYSIKKIQAHLKNKNYTAAKSLLHKRIEQKPKQGHPHYLLAQIYEKMNKIPEAKAEINQAIQKEPKNKKFYLKALELYQDNSRELVFLTTKMQEHLGSTPQVLKLLCTYLLSEGFVVKSFKTCKKALKKNPKDFETYKIYGESLSHHGTDKELKNFYQKAIKKFPNKSIFYERFARLLTKEGLYNPSQKILAKALALEKDEASIYQAIAMNFLHLKKYDLSLRYYSKACKLDQGLLNEVQRTYHQIPKTVENHDLLKTYRNSWTKCWRPLKGSN